MSSLAFTALGIPVAVTTETPLLYEHLRNITASFSVAKEPAELRYDFVTTPAPMLRFNGEVIRSCDSELDLLAVFEWDLYQRIVVRGSASRWLLHAAAVSWRERTFVFVGPSGAGKSTAVLALMQQGATYLSDDCVAIDEALALEGYRRPLSFDQVTAPPDKMMTQCRLYRVPVRHDEGTWNDLLRIIPPEPNRTTAAPFGALLRWNFRPNQPRAVQRRSAAEAVTLLWPHTVGSQSPALRIATAAVAQIPCYECWVGCLDDVQAVVNELC